MAALSAQDRATVLKRFGRDLSDSRIPFNVSKPDLAAAIAGIDDWVEANQASFNSAIPLPARTQLSAKHKVQLFVAIVLKRFEVS